MRRALTVAVFVGLIAIVAIASDKPPDVSGESEASLHRFVDRPVLVRGRFSMRGKVAPFIDTGKVQIYLKPENGPDFDSESEGKQLVAIGTLHYQPENRSPDSSIAGVKAYFYLGGDCAFLKPGVL
jgi:hypothetical protein